MNRTDRPLGPYEERLLHELRSHVVARSEAGHVSVDRAGVRRLARHRRRGPRLVFAGVAVAALATAVIAATARDDARAAYAVEPNGDGSVTVEIRALEDAQGLEDKLRAAGVPAEVDYLPAGKMCKEPRFRAQTPAKSSGSIEQIKTMMKSNGGATEFTIDRGSLQPGQTLVITTSTGGSEDGKHFASIGMTVADGPVAPCEPVDAPPPGDGSAPVPPGASLDSGGGAGVHDDGGPSVESRAG